MRNIKFISYAMFTYQYVIEGTECPDLASALYPALLGHAQFSMRKLPQRLEPTRPRSQVGIKLERNPAHLLLVIKQFESSPFVRVAQKIKLQFASLSAH